MVSTGELDVDGFTVPAGNGPKADGVPPPKPQLEICVFTDPVAEQPKAIKLPSSVYGKRQRHEYFRYLQEF